MGRGSKYFKEIQHLLEIGYEPKQIVEITGCSRRTVDRVTHKLKTEARYEFKTLLTEDYLWKYQKTLENYSKTIQQCNEELVSMNLEYAIIRQKVISELEITPDAKGMTKATLLTNLANLQSSRTNEMIKLTAQRDRATSEKARVYNQGPVVYAMDEWVNRTNPTAGELPTITEVNKIYDKPQALNKEYTVRGDANIPKPVKITAEDEAVLKEMDEE